MKDSKDRKNLRPNFEKKRAWLNIGKGHLHALSAHINLNSQKCPNIKLYISIVRKLVIDTTKYLDTFDFKNLYA